MADIKHHGKKLQPAGIAALMSEASGWRPEEGDEVEGVVLGVKMATSDFGTYPIVFVLGNDDEPVALHCFHTALQNEMTTQRPERGDDVYVKYLGPKSDYDSSKGYKAPELYSVLVTKLDDARSVWDTVPAPRSSSEPERPNQFADEAPF